MQHDRSRDYRHWRAKEPVTFAQANGATVALSHALRIQPQDTAEKEPTGAKYLSRQVRWLLPGRLMPTVTVLPKDAIADRNGGVWVVQKVSYNHFDRVWTVDCLELFLHPRLADSVTVQRPRLEADGRLPRGTTGGEVYDWQNAYVDVPAACVFKGRKPTVLNAIVGGDEQWHVVVAQQLVLTSRDVVLFSEFGTGTVDALTLDVLDYTDYSQIGALPMLTCVRHP